LTFNGWKNQQKNNNEKLWIIKFKLLLKYVTCISGSIASPNEKAITPRALNALKVLREGLPCKL
jgi:hypothetical protein